MTNKQFEAAMRKCGRAHAAYLHALSIIEAEYEGRYGIHPSEVSNDFWIDTFHSPPGNGDASVEQVEESVRLHHGIYVRNNWNKKAV